MKLFYFYVAQRVYICNYTYFFITPVKRYTYSAILEE